MQRRCNIFFYKDGLSTRVTMGCSYGVCNISWKKLISNFTKATVDYFHILYDFH